MRFGLPLLPMMLLTHAVYAADIQTDQYQITFPDNDRVSYHGKWQARFPNGFPMGVGSGLSFIRRENLRNLIFAKSRHDKSHANVQRNYLFRGRV
ncbi:hypothetical protein [Dickeya ananatis]|uniref:hypothetical protein n=1 Tax=Dickeya ananatis TaxID=3061286 RepID=UPI00388D7893